MYRTNQERALAELKKKQNAERKKRPMSSEQLDRFLIKQAREIGMLDGYKGPDKIDSPEMMDFITGGGLLGMKK